MSPPSLQSTAQPSAQPSALLACMADGIGDLAFASPQWVDLARDVLRDECARHAAGLADLGAFTLCEVAHNPPAWLGVDGPLAWHARFDGASVEVGSGELPTTECTFKLGVDHAIISNLCRIQYQGRDPALVAAAQARLSALGRWDVHGQVASHPVLGAVLAALHDALAARTMPRLTFMTPEWVANARHILTSRATSTKYAAALRDVVFTFAEEFTDTPAYAFPDGAHGGFWVHVNYGRITVGAGPLPAAYGPADMLTRGLYTPVVPVGRTVNALLDAADKAALEAYTRTALRFDKTLGRRPVEQSSPSGRGEMPAALARVFVPLHDELAKRTSGELPADFDDSIRPEWASAQSFDRNPGYDPSWLRYRQVDIYGQPRV